jgi:hypothetical protein
VIKPALISHMLVSICSFGSSKIGIHDTMPPDSIACIYFSIRKYANHPIFKDYSKSFLNLFAARFAALLVGSRTSAY